MGMRSRGPVGSVKGVPEPEVTAILHQLIKRLATEGLEFQRSRAREILLDLGVEPGQIDGFLFSLQRAVPGIENTGFGTYRLPEDWDMAARHRTWRFRPVGLDVLDAHELLAILEAQRELTPGLKKTYRQLRSELHDLD